MKMSTNNRKRKTLDEDDEFEDEKDENINTNNSNNSTIKQPPIKKQKISEQQLDIEEFGTFLYLYTISYKNIMN